MQPTTPINASDSLSTDNTNQPQKTNQPEPSTDHTPNFIDILEQTKTWMNMIPDVFISEIRGFFEAVKCSNSVDVYDRHKVQIEYDTLQFSNTINKSATQKSLRITNFKLGLIRNMIYLYLAFNRKADYRKSWTSIAYTVLTLGLNEEENFCIFSHLLENVLSGFFLALKNYQKKRETVADFYLLAELKSYIFPAISSSSLDLKAMKTLPNYSKNHKNKSNTFAGLFHIPKIFRGKPQSISISNTSQNPNMSLQRIDPVSPKSSHIKNYELFCLLQAVADIWFGTLFTNILSLNETLELWDYLFRYGNNFLYQFSLALLTQADLKLATIIKKEKMTYFTMGIEDPQSIFSMLLPSIKKTLKTPLTPSEFQATLKMAKTLEAFVKDNRELMEVKRKQIVKTTQAERVRRLLVTRRELEAKGTLSEHRVKAIIRSIDEYDAETFLLQDVLNILKKEQVVSPYLGSKIFSFIDSSLKGFLEPIELRIFFIMLTETPRKKLQLLWEELSNKKPIISVDEAIKVLQVIDQFIIPNSSQIDEKVADIYQTWIRVLPDDNVPIKDFVEFFKKCKACKPLLTILEAIDGTVPLKSELSFDDREPLQTRGTTRQQEKNFESFIDFSINDEFGKTQQDDAKSKSDISLVVDHVIEGRLSSKENRNENEQEHENSVGNIVTLFDSARNKIKNFARSLSANRSNGSARSNPIQNDCPMSKSSGVPEKFVLLGETNLPQHQAAPVKQIIFE